MWNRLIMEVYYDIEVNEALRRRLKRTGYRECYAIADPKLFEELRSQVIKCVALELGLDENLVRLFADEVLLDLVTSHYATRYFERVCD